MRLMIACRAIDNMAGGVERQAIALANEMVKRGHEVAILTLDFQNAQAFYDIDPSVSWYKVGLGDPVIRASWSLRFKRMFHIRKVMAEFKPGVILAFQDGMFVSLLLYTLGLKSKLVAAERESLDRYKYVKYRTSQTLVFFAYKFASKITIQCDSYVDKYPKNLRSKLAVVHNSIRKVEISAYPKQADERSKIILCVGRLTYQKNQMVLLKAFSKIHEKHDGWILQFVGSGDMYSAIINEAKNLGIGSKIEFIDAVRNIGAYYQTAQFLCIPSYWEGFPNVLGEALAHGLPAVGYLDCGGVCDLINDGENGILANGNGTPDTLEKALDTIISDTDLREAMASSAKQSVERYAPKVVYDKWEQVFEGLVNDRKC